MKSQNNNRNYGKKLRELRGARSKREVAAAIGVSVSSYTKYERNERNPGDDIKRDIARFFGRSVQEIFFATDEHI
jgi:transcriptional regulator with XRE-family HTH domain